MASLQGFEILLVEDAGDLAAQYRKVLESDGAVVHVATTAKSGLVAAMDQFPHLIICDLGLIGLGAFQFLAALERAPGLRSIPVLALSRTGDMASILRARTLGVGECLLKPFVASTLLQRVEKLLADRPVLRKSFTADRMPVAQATVPMEIVRVGEGGLTVEAQVALGPEKPVTIDAPLLEQLGCKEVLTRSSDETPRPGPDGAAYANEINFLGVSPKAARTIRSFLRSKQTEGASS